MAQAQMRSFSYGAALPYHEFAGSPGSGKPGPCTFKLWTPEAQACLTRWADWLAQTITAGT